jgi:dolichol kinase
MTYLFLALRGAVIVGLISWQTRSLQRGNGVRIACGAFAIGVFWYSNVLATVAEVPLGWLAYATGSSMGALIGWKADKWL